MENVNRPQEELIIASIVFPNEDSEREAILLADSIRTFGGGLARAPLWWFVPKYLAQDGARVDRDLSVGAQERLLALDVELIPFEIDVEVARFFFATDLTAAALAEERAGGQTEQLAWLCANTLVLREPGAFMLGEGKQVGYRPVHHTNVGSRYGEVPDAFWSAVYRCCKVPREKLFPMVTHVDQVAIRPYFNAGHLVVRPERGLLRAWRGRFFAVYRTDEFKALYQADRRYVIFVHQAILSGVLLACLDRDEMQEMPGTYNYPLHLYAEDGTSERPSRLEELVTCRYEDWDDLASLSMPAGDEYRAWLEGRLGWG
ncbi:MAG: hypothetical protein JXA93_23665 [Anaerolineae bacterium]|nr:hypothetical protein [Anaerolineae bacterium]